MSHFSCQIRRVFCGSILFAAGLSPLHAQQAPVDAKNPVVAAKTALPAGWVDAGLEPVSAPVENIVITFKRTDAQQADLNQLLQDQSQPGTPSYHQWLTPAEFAARFQPDQNSVDVVSSWFTQQGLTVDAVSAARTQMRVHGTVDVAQRVFGTQLHRFVNTSVESRSPSTDLTLPTMIAAQVSTIEGMDQLSLSDDSMVAWMDFAAKVDANTDAVLTLLSDAVCHSSSADALAASYVPVLEQAIAQGITVLVSGACAGDAMPPAATAYATAVRATGETIRVSEAADGETRPDWQSVSGLPDGNVRAVPDVSLSGDIDSLAQTMNTIVLKAGTRQGSINSTLYSLSAIKGIYDQPVSTWESGSGLGTVNLEALVRAWPFGTAATNVTLVSNTYSPTHGQSFTLTATINGTTDTPTGTMIFKSSSTGELSTASMNGTQATYMSSTLNGGTYDFTAFYSGDNTYAGSTGGPATVTIQPEETTISAVTSSVGLGANIPVVVTAKSASGVGTPSGTASVQTTGSSSTQTYTAAFGTVYPGIASATVMVPATIAGNLTLIVKCAFPSTSFACNTSNTVQAAVAKGTPTVTLTSAEKSDGSYDLTATMTVSSLTSAETPTGAVQFMDGTTALATGTITNGVASAHISFTGSGKHTITAVYQGDGNYNTVTSNALSLDGTLVATTTSITADKYTGSNGTAITLIGTVSPASLVNATLPTGTITFTSSLQGVLGTVSVSNYSGSLAISSLQAGTHTITATYNADSNYAASTSAGASFIITASAGTLAATISPATSIGYGSAATVTATVTTTDGLAPGGTIQAVVSNGSTYLAALVGGTGKSTATLSIEAPIPGTYSVVVSCVASTSLTCSNTVKLSLVVVKGPTTTTLSLTPLTPVAGSPLTLTAGVAPSAASSSSTLAAISGSVVFTDNGVLLGMAPISNGVAVLTTTLKTASTNSLVAKYSGDANWAPSDSAAQSVSPSPVDPTVTISASTLSPLANASVILTAKVTQVSGSILFPTGSVIFYDSYNGTSRPLGTAKLVSNGVDGSVASFSTTALAGGTHTVYALYSGDDSFNAARSNDLALTAGDFALVMTPSTLSILRGSSGSAQAVITVQGGFAGDIALGCTPSAGTLTTCSVSPGVLSGAGIATVTVSTSSATSSMRRIPNKTTMLQAGAVLSLVFCGLWRHRSLRLRAILAVLLLSCLAASMTGCSNGIAIAGSSDGGGSISTGGTPLGTSIFTITASATDGSTVARHSYSFQVTVQ